MINGDNEKETFEELYDDFYPKLHKVAYRIVGRLDVAEELCQEAFVRYYERRDRLPSGEEARFWLIRVVKNLAYNHEKRQGREREAYREFASQPRELPRNEGERQLLAEESRQAVREALLGVPYKLRIVLILKEYAGYRYRDIARILKISEGNVKIRVFRARQYLAENLKEGDSNVP
jgi:RNA polymerase sigma-70 factor (ECF subfamily)